MGTLLRTRKMLALIIIEIKEKQMSFYHGGAPGLLPGEIVLPSNTTGAKPAVGLARGGVAKRLYRGDRVYLTQDFKFALFFAARHSSGAGQVYEVEPIGDLETDVHWHLLNTEGTGYSETKQCEAARIIDVTPIPDWMFEDARELMTGSAPVSSRKTLTAKQLVRRAFEKKQRKLHRRSKRR